jgi:hypothetical protein
MFSGAWFQITDSDHRCALCWGQGDVSIFSEVPSQFWCSTFRTALEPAPAELNSCSDSIPDQVRLPAIRRPCFG